MPGLYLHIPFCERKCIYCDFYSIEIQSRREDFVGALCREIDTVAPLGTGRVFDTVFFGGGTPSLLSPEHLGGILDRLRARFAVSGDAEITLEANPGAVDLAHIGAFRQLGINRLSIGVQSFHDDDLRFLGRIHNRDQAFRAVELARGAGYDNVSIDLIFALPGQSPARWEENLRTAVQLAPDHIAAYSLIVEENTPLSRLVRSGTVRPMATEDEARQYESTMDYLRAHGYEQYEVSNFARAGKRSRHNLNYWHHGEYLGFGPSAHSFWQKEGEPRRWRNIADLAAYLDRVAATLSPVDEEERLSARDLINERIFLGLRSDGITIPVVTGEPGDSLGERQRATLQELVARGLAIEESGRCRLTRNGYLLCDEIAERLMLP